ncbi:MAG TPA: hypothetical protein PLP17_13430, partial [Oligoflexia bacterium]|nr:hypothetical protein [Oligoflexia bacterium]
MARIEARAKLYSAIPEASKREEITSGLEGLETALSGRSPAQITGEEVRGALRLFGQRQELEQLFMRDPQFAENLSAYLALAAGGRGILEPQIRSVIANEIGSVQDAAAELQQALDGPARVSAVYRLCCRTGGMIPASEMEQAYLAHTGKPLGEVLAKLPASERGLIYSMLDGVMPNEQTLLAYYCAKLESYRRAQAAGNQPECQRIESELIAEIRGSAKLILRSPQFLLACEELAESAPALSFCARSVRMENELTQLLPENRQRAVCAILDAFNSQAHSARAAHGQKPDGDAAVVVLEQAAISACIKELEADGKSLQEVVEANPRLAQLLPAYFAHRLGTPSGERAAAQLSRVLQQQFISSHDVEYSTVGLQHQVRPTMGLVSPEEAQLYYENGGGDRRQALLLRYESAREALAQHRERTEQGAVQPAESQGPFRLASLPSGAGADSAQVDFAQRAAPLIQEMQLLIREYGPLMP